MADVRLTDTALHRARAAARAASGSKPTHAAEAVASGCGYRSHAALLAALGDGPPTGLPATWTPEACRKRLVQLSPDLGARAEIAASAAGEELARGPASAVERIAELARRVSAVGGGHIVVDDDLSGTRIRVSCRSDEISTHEIRGGMEVDGLSFDDLARETVAAGRPDLPGWDGGSVWGTLPAKALALPADTVPGSFHVMTLPRLRRSLTVGIPPAVSTHGGLDALGLPAGIDERLRHYVSAKPGVRILAGLPGAGKTHVARLAAIASARKAGKDLLDLTEAWAAHWDHGDDRVPAKEWIYAQVLLAGVEGRVVLMPTVHTHQDADIAMRLAGARAAVWTGIDAGGESQGERRAAMFRFDLDVTPLFHLPAEWRIGPR